METKTVTVKNTKGIHARPALEIVKECKKFNSIITIKNEENGFEADGDSVLSVMQLIAEKGVRIKVSAEGEDEKKAVDKVSHVIENLVISDDTDKIPLAKDIIKYAKNT